MDGSVREFPEPAPFRDEQMTMQYCSHKTVCWSHSMLTDGVAAKRL